MPRFDGTGPSGRGPMTGWGTGYCASETVSGPAGAPGRGLGLGLRRGGFGRRIFGRRGRGLGFGAGYGATDSYYSASPVQERQALEDITRDLKTQLNGIEQRLSEMKSGDTKD